MENKKLTKAQIESKLRNALVFVPRDKEYKSVYFDDKGLRLESTQDSVCIHTNFHTHIFSAITTQGYSRPYLYISQFIDIANSNDCIVNDEKGNPMRSMAKLLEVLKKKDNETEYHIATYISWYLHNIFSPLYSIDESEVGSFLVYEQYLHNIARQSFLLAEHKEDVTNKQFVNEVLEKEKSFIEGVEEMVILHAKTDEERVKEEMEALQEQAIEEGVQKQIEADGTTNK